MASGAARQLQQSTSAGILQIQELTSLDTGYKCIGRSCVHVTNAEHRPPSFSIPGLHFGQAPLQSPMQTSSRYTVASQTDDTVQNTIELRNLLIKLHSSGIDISRLTSEIQSSIGARSEAAENGVQSLCSVGQNEADIDFITKFDVEPLLRRVDDSHVTSCAQKPQLPSDQSFTEALSCKPFLRRYVPNSPVLDKLPEFRCQTSSTQVCVNTRAPSELIGKTLSNSTCFSETYRHREQPTFNGHGKVVVGLDQTSKCSSCHQCKTLHVDSSLYFCAKSYTAMSGSKQERKERLCRKKYCYRCLAKYYPEKPPDPTDPRAKDTWHCPACLNLCTCAACKRQRSKRAVKRATQAEIELAEWKAHHNRTQPASSGPNVHDYNALRYQVQAAVIPPVLQQPQTKPQHSLTDGCASSTVPVTSRPFYDGTVNVQLLSALLAQQQQLRQNTAALHRYQLLLAEQQTVSEPFYVESGKEGQETLSGSNPAYFRTALSCSSATESVEHGGSDVCPYQRQNTKAPAQYYGMLSCAPRSPENIAHIPPFGLQTFAASNTPSFDIWLRNKLSRVHQPQL